MRTFAAVAAGIAALAAAGCGGDEDFANDPRPPAIVTLTASIGPRAVSISPGRLGAGPVSLLIVNQTDARQAVTFSSTAGDGFEAKSGPILPQDTATLRVDVTKGRAVVRVEGEGIREAKLTVGPERASAQNDLLQP